jgi:hypothetical protein
VSETFTEITETGGEAVVDGVGEALEEGLGLATGVGGGFGGEDRHGGLVFWGGGWWKS